MDGQEQRQVTQEQAGVASDPTGQEQAEPSPKDPAEQEALARDIGDELTDIFISFVRQEITFADLTFLTYESLENVFIIAGGQYELEYDDEDDEDDEEDDEDAIEEQEDLAQEPARE